MHDHVPAATYRKRLFVVFVGILASVALALSAVSSAQAAPAAVHVQTPAPPSPTHAQKVQAKVAAKVMRTGSKRTLDYRKAKTAAGRHHVNVARDFALGVLYKGGKVSHRSKADNKALRARAKKLGLRPSLVGLAAAPAACAGTNKLVHTWYGIRMNIDECNVQKILAGAATVAFVGGSLATIVTLDAKSKAVMGIALVIIGAGAFALTICDAPKRGVKVYNYSGIGSGLGSWCLSQ